MTPSSSGMCTSSTASSSGKHSTPESALQESTTRNRQMASRCRSARGRPTSLLNLRAISSGALSSSCKMIPKRTWPLLLCLLLASYTQVGSQPLVGDITAVIFRFGLTKLTYTNHFPLGSVRNKASGGCKRLSLFIYLFLFGKTLVFQ